MRNAYGANADANLFSIGKDIGFYTLNGVDLNLEMRGVPADPHPAIRLCNPGDTVDVNFGDDMPFLFNLTERSAQALQVF